MKIRPKRYIVWSTNKEIDLDDPWQRKWYIGEVLSHGGAEDVAELDWEEVKKSVTGIEFAEESSEAMRRLFPTC